MTEKEMLRKVYYFTEDQIDDCSRGMCGCLPTSESSARGPFGQTSNMRFFYGGKWDIMQRAQHIENLAELNEQLSSWKSSFEKKLASNNSLSYEGDPRNMTERNNDEATLEGKITACNKLLEYISKLES